MTIFMAQGEHNAYMTMAALWVPWESVAGQCQVKCVVLPIGSVPCDCAVSHFMGKKGKMAALFNDFIYNDK